MSVACTFEGCTVGDTGRCILEHNTETCPNRVPEVDVTTLISDSRIDDEGKMSNQFGLPVLESPTDNPSFPSSRTLGIEAIREMMADQYVNIVGILGDPESGKTATLASLYLLISHATLKGWSFADSRSLMGFEEIARGARQWNAGNPPEQMTVHTEMADERHPGFLHVRLKSNDDGRCVDLALPDIPGEWTKDLLRKSRTDRLQFLKAADVIWLVVDGRTLVDKSNRQGAIARLGQLVGRLKTMMDGEAIPRLLLVLTHHDVGEVPVSIIEKINTELTKYNIVFEIMRVASFSDVNEVKAGTGIAELIEATVNCRTKPNEFWPLSYESRGRNYLKYRGER